MARNQKLAPLLAHHAIATVDPPAPGAAPPASPFAPSPASTWHVRFADGSVLAVRTDGTPPTGADHAAGAGIADVTQRGTTLTLTFAPPASGALVFQTAEPAGCVMLRDGRGAMAYAD